MSGGCIPTTEQNGWYVKLFLTRQDVTKTNPTIADVHTNPADREILHVGTGLPRLMVVTADGCNGPRAYAGVVSSYYEKTAGAGVRVARAQVQAAHRRAVRNYGNTGRTAAGGARRSSRRRDRRRPGSRPWPRDRAARIAPRRGCVARKPGRQLLDARLDAVGERARARAQPPPPDVRRHARVALERVLARPARASDRRGSAGR